MPRRINKPECREEYEVMMLPPSLWGVTQEELTPSTKPVLDKLIDDAATYCRKGYVLVIYGGPGTGKSSAAAVVAKKTMETGIRALWTCPGMLRDAVRWELDYNSQRSYLFHTQQVSLLVIDDLVEADFDYKQYGRNEYRDLLRRRSSYGKSTIVTTSMPPEVWRWIYDALPSALVCLDTGFFDRRKSAKESLPEIPHRLLYEDLDDTWPEAWKAQWHTHQENALQAAQGYSSEI